MISPFFVLPFALIPIGVWTGVLTGNHTLLMILGPVLILYGAYTVYLLVRRPEELAATENHPSWTHMYRMLPLWLIGVGVLVPFVAAAYLNQRLFRYDALPEHASAGEMAALFRSERNAWWGLGLLTGLLQFVPLLNLLGPVVAALAFIHFALARLDQRRTSTVG